MNSINKKTTFFNNQSGNTLIEAVISLCSISLGVLALGNLQAKLIQSSTIVAHRAYAMTLAKMKIEDLRTEAASNQFDNIVNGKSSYDSENTAYAVSWTVTDNANDYYKAIQLTVSWTELDGQNSNVELNADLANLYQ